VLKKRIADALMIVSLMIAASLAPIQPTIAQPYFFHLTILTGVDDVPHLEYCQPYWKEIGIDTSIVTMEWTPQTELMISTTKTYDEGGWDLSAYNLVAGRIPDPDQITNYHRTGAMAYMRWNNSYGDELLEEGVREIDLEKRREIYWKWQELVYEEVPIIILWAAEMIAVYSPNVEGIEEAAKWIYVSEPAWKTIWMRIPGSDTIVVADAWIPSQYLPHLVGGWLCDAYTAPLMWPYPNGTAQPELAESYEWSDGGRTVTFDLRDDVVWSDGTPFTSKDVKFTFDVVLNPDSASRLHSTMADMIDSVEAPDNDTAVFHLEDPNVALLAQISSKNVGMLPWHILKDIPVTEMKDTDYNTIPGLLPSLGPYKPIDQKTGEWIEFEANPLWYGWGKFGRPATPPFQTMIWKFIAEKSIAIAAVEAGEVNHADEWYGFYESLPEIDAKPDKFQWIAAPTWTSMPSLYPNFNHPILSNKWVRKAMSYAIPREEYVHKVFHDVSEPNELPYTKDSYWYNPNIDPNPRPFDLDKAKECMENAGFDYAWLEEAAAPLPYLEFAVILVAGLAVGAVIGAIVFRRRSH